jgi:hypothetical protein
MVSKPIKHMDLEEFINEGFLQEANRQFFHPLGLALEMSKDEEGHWSISGIWDYRGDDEGMLFGNDELSYEKRDRVAREFERHFETRLQVLNHNRHQHSPAVQRVRYYPSLESDQS